MGKVELLSPAGEYDTMVAAFNAGADAVYLGGNRFGARALPIIFLKRKLSGLLSMLIYMAKRST